MGCSDKGTLEEIVDCKKGRRIEIDQSLINTIKKNALADLKKQILKELDGLRKKINDKELPMFAGYNKKDRCFSYNDIKEILEKVLEWNTTKNQTGLY